MYRTAFLPYKNMFCEYMETKKKNDMQVLQYHDCYEIYMLTKGERYLFYDGICHELKPMDMFIMKPYEMHYTQSLSSDFYARYLVNFSETHLEKLLTPLECQLILDKLESGIIHLNQEQYNKCTFLFEGVSEYSSNTDMLSTKLQCSYLLELLAYIGKLSRIDNPATRILAPNTKPEILKAIRYINAHYMEPLTLDFIAEYVHLSKYYFCRQFAKTAGVTYIEYLNNVRLSKVHQLLLNSDYSISEIAAKTGFSSAVHLSRVFKSVYGVAPVEFRKK